MNIANERLEERDPLRDCLQWLNDNPDSPVEDCMSAGDVADFLSELLSLRTGEGDEVVIGYDPGSPEGDQAVKVAVMTLEEFEQLQEQLRAAQAEVEKWRNKSASMERRVDQLENTLTQMNIGLPHWED